MYSTIFLLIGNLLISAKCGEISQRKCNEYKDLVYRKTSCLPGGACTKVLVCDRSKGLIVGGEEAGKYEFPHFALLGYGGDDREHFKCGGSIISEKFVLTAGHCQFDNDQQATIVRVGEHIFYNFNHYRKDYEIDEFIRHPDYFYNTNEDTIQNDIALVKVKNKINFSPSVRPACLHQNKDEILKGKDMIAIGYGALGFGEDSSDVLMKVKLSVTPGRCKGLLANIQSQVCVKGEQTDSGEYRDTCGGDSGGPIQKKRTDIDCTFDLYGITSYGRPCGHNFGAVYTRVSYYLPWIEEKVWGSN